MRQSLWLFLIVTLISISCNMTFLAHCPVFFVSGPQFCLFESFHQATLHFVVCLLVAWFKIITFTLYIIVMRVLNFYLYLCIYLNGKIWDKKGCKSFLKHYKKNTLLDKASNLSIVLSFCGFTIQIVFEKILCVVLRLLSSWFQSLQYWLVNMLNSIF